MVGLGTKGSRKPFVCNNWSYLVRQVVSFCLQGKLGNDFTSR